MQFGRQSVCEQCLQQQRPRVIRLPKASLEPIAESHQLVDLSDDTTLLGERRQRQWKTQDDVARNIFYWNVLTPEAFLA